MTRLRGPLAVVAVAGATALAAGPAAADPVAACPSSYELFPVPQDGSRPVAADLDAKGNQDRYACQKAFGEAAAAHVGAPYNVIDNRVR